MKDICDNCQEPELDLHLCRANSATCVDGEGCLDFVTHCACSCANNPTKERVDELVEYQLDGMDMDTLLAFAREQLTEYYLSDDGEQDFDSNYEEMQEVMAL